MSCTFSSSYVNLLCQQTWMTIQERKFRTTFSTMFYNESNCIAMRQWRIVGQNKFSRRSSKQFSLLNFQWLVKCVDTLLCAPKPYNVFLFSISFYPCRSTQQHSLRNNKKKQQAKKGVKQHPYNVLLAAICMYLTFSLGELISFFGK